MGNFFKLEPRKDFIKSKKYVLYKRKTYIFVRLLRMICLLNSIRKITKVNLLSH